MTIFAAMFALLVLGMGIIGFSEQAGTAQLAQNGAVLLEAGDMQPGGNMEYKLLAVLARNSGKVLTYKYLLRQVWGSALESDMASLRGVWCPCGKSWQKAVAGSICRLMWA